LSDVDSSGATAGTSCVPLETVTEVARDLYYVTKTLANLRKLIPPI